MTALMGGSGLPKQEITAMCSLMTLDDCKYYFPHHEVHPSVKGVQHSVSVWYLDISQRPFVFTGYKVRSTPSCSNLILDVRLWQFPVVNRRGVLARERNDET